jgi:CRISPR-associated protein Csm3
MKLIGKIIIKGKLTTLTGLHIGGSKSTLAIGGIDNNVIKTARNLPYIPGSSLKGKLRSLLAKKDGSLFFQKKDKDAALDELRKKLLKRADDKTLERYLDVIENAPSDTDLEYLVDLFGYSGDSDKENERVGYTRLFVRDSFLLNEKDENVFPNEEYTHGKMENRIDRRTGTAEHPRQVERVPVNAEFGLELVYNIYDDIKENEDKFFNHLQHIAIALKLLEDDFIGGQGSRGYGQVDVKIDMEKTKLKLIKEYEYTESKEWKFDDQESNALASFKNALETL